MGKVFDSINGTLNPGQQTAFNTERTNEYMIEFAGLLGHIMAQNDKREKLLIAQIQKMDSIIELLEKKEKI